MHIKVCLQKILFGEKEKLKPQSKDRTQNGHTPGNALYKSCMQYGKKQAKDEPEK